MASGVSPPARQSSGRSQRGSARSVRPTDSAIQVLGPNGARSFGAGRLSGSPRSSGAECFVR